MTTNLYLVNTSENADHDWYCAYGLLGFAADGRAAVEADAEQLEADDNVSGYTRAIVVAEDDPIGAIAVEGEGGWARAFVREACLGEGDDGDCDDYEIRADGCTAWDSGSWTAEEAGRRLEEAHRLGAGDVHLYRVDAFGARERCGTDGQPIAE